MHLQNQVYLLTWLILVLIIAIIVRLRSLILEVQIIGNQARWALRCLQLQTQINSTIIGALRKDLALVKLMEGSQQDQ